MGTQAGEVKVGVFLPTFCGPEGRSGEEIAAFSRRAEELGFDSLWATDHLLHGSIFYDAAWLDPLMALSFAACATSSVRLGTSILVLPTRHPVALAKDIATLQVLSGGRFILGAGTGWDAREFEATGIRKSERGARTDESLHLIRSLLPGKPVTFRGRFHEVREIQIGPALETPLEIWVAGGQQLARPESPELPRLAPSVLKRIAAADGWIARPTATPDQIAEDRLEIVDARRALYQEHARFTVAHENFLHLVDTEDPDVARDEQRRVFTSVMGRGRPFEYFDAVYLTGTRSEIEEKLRRRVRAGVRYLLLHTLEPSTRQLDLWSERLLPAVRSESAVGA